MRAVLWDLDGTLLPDNIFPPQAAALRAALEICYGVQGVYDVDWVGKTDLGIAREIAKAAGIAELDFNGSLDVYQRIYFKQFKEHCPQRVEPRNGASDALWDLDDRGIMSVTVTGNIRPVAAEKLHRAGLLIDIERSAFGDDAEHRPHIVFTALERLSWETEIDIDTMKGEVVLIGDTWRDVAAAREAGIKCIALATPKHGVVELKGAGAEHVVRSLDEAVESVKEMSYS